MQMRPTRTLAQGCGRNYKPNCDLFVRVVIFAKVPPDGRNAGSLDLWQLLGIASAASPTGCAGGFMGTFSLM